MSEKEGVEASGPPPQYTPQQPGPQQYQGQYQTAPTNMQYSQGQPTYPAQGQPAYPAQGQPVYPAQGQPAYATQGVIVTSPGPVRFSQYPMQVHCPSCNQTVHTKIAYENGLLVWISVGIICLFGGIFGCCLIPFCIKDLKNVRHTCPNDNTYLGLHDRSRGF